MKIGDLVDYLRNGLNSGMSMPELKEDLSAKGWSKKNINEAISELNSIPFDKISYGNAEKLEKSPFVSIKSIMFISGILLVGLFFMFSSFNSETISEVIINDISNGTVIEFTESNVNIKMENGLMNFKIRGVDEYIVRYTFGNFEGELFLRETIVVDSDSNGENDTELRLEKIIDGVPQIYIKEIQKN